MPDWTQSMEQTFEYYMVDPGSWCDKNQLTDVIQSNIEWDSDADTLGSATFDMSSLLGECYIRVYLITIQNGIKEKFPMGTFLVQTPKSNFDGRYQKVSIDAYTPLLELKENPPPIGYSILKGGNVMSNAYKILRDNMRAPVVETTATDKLYNDFVANTSDSWLTFTKDLVANAKYNLGLDEMGRVLFLPDQDAASLQPVWTYTDDNSSILYPDISLEHDIYGIPNVVEVLYSGSNDNYYARVVNDDPNSPTSTVNRGREIIHRVTDLQLAGEPTDRQIKDYATTLLSQLSSVEYTLSYSHGYCPVRLYDCVRLNYERAGLIDIKAKVTKQSIECAPGCKVTETAVFTTNLWR